VISGDSDTSGVRHADEMANVYARHCAELVLDFGWSDLFRPAAWRAIRESAARYWQWTEAGRMAREGQRDRFNPRAW
jgi:hypothetical protein